MIEKVNRVVILKRVLLMEVKVINYFKDVIMLGEKMD